VSALARTPRAIQVPGAPPISGLVFRSYAGLADHPSLARVANAAAAADGETYVRSVAELDTEFANLRNCDPDRDILVAEVGGEVVAYSLDSYEDQNWGGRSYESWGAVHPEWRRRGIGTAMLRWNEAHLREIAGGQTYAGPRWLGTHGSDANPGLVALMRRDGYTRVRGFHLMVRPDLQDIQVPPLPEDVEIRALAPDQYRTVFRAAIEAFKDHFGGAEDADEWFREWVDGPHFDPSLILVAWDGDEVAGGVINTIRAEENRTLGIRRGFLDDVFTRRPWRRRGLARALLGRSLVLLRDRGMTSAALGVDATNPNQALGLYESAGFRVAESDSAYRKPWDPAIGPEWVGLDVPPDQRGG
jgi:mycothiol synthase